MMSRRPMFAGRVVVVTGASKGIGFACAEAFAAPAPRSRSFAQPRESRRGARAAGRPPPTPSRSRRICAIPTTRRGWSTRRKRRLGPIDVLVNSAGAAQALCARGARRAGMARRDGRQVLQLHPSDRHRRQAHGRARARRHRQHHRHGRQGRERVRICPAGAANAALMLATAGLAAVYGPQGVRVNGINPGGTLTGRVQEGLSVESRMTGTPTEELLARAQAKIPLRRLATPEEIAQVALFLASDARELRHRRAHSDGRRRRFRSSRRLSNVSYRRSSRLHRPARIARRAEARRASPSIRSSR